MLDEAQAKTGSTILESLANLATKCTLTLQESLHDFKAILQTERNHANSRGDRVPATNPVPETKGVFWVNAKGLDQLEVGADSHHVLGCSLCTQLSCQPRPAWQSVSSEKRRNDYAFQSQFNEKPSIIPSCIAKGVMTLACRILRDMLCLVHMLSDRRTLPCSVCVSQSVLGRFNHMYVKHDIRPHKCSNMSSRQLMCKCGWVTVLLMEMPIV